MSLRGGYLLFPTKQPPDWETAHLHCNTPALADGARERSAAQVSAKTTPALVDGARESASQRHYLPRLGRLKYLPIKCLERL
jgi:hypothetical protein